MALEGKRTALSANGGAGLRVLTEAITSPTLGEQPLRSAYELVRVYWDSYYGGLSNPAQPTSDIFWRTALHDGVVAGTAAPAVEVSLAAALAETLRQPPTALAEGLEIIFRPDPSIWDGRFANNSWLQELPKPLLTLTWDNAALINPALASNCKFKMMKPEEVGQVQDG